ncbi:MAG TPA: YheU family protein [Steroidobacteraceae bacterium]
MDEPPEAIVVPYSEMPEPTLRAVVESFVLREGTEYGAREFTLEEKVAHVIAQLERGLAQVVFEPGSQSINIVMAAPPGR